MTKKCDKKLYFQGVRDNFWVISRSQPKILRKIQKNLGRYISTISRFLHVWVLVGYIGYLLGICWVLVGYILNEDFGEAPKSLNQAAATSCLYQFLHISTTKRALSLIVFLNTHQNSPPAALSTSHIYHWGFLYNRVTGSSLSK